MKAKSCDLEFWSPSQNKYVEIGSCTNMEEAQAAYSKKEFCSKIGISHKEARESNYWLRLLKDSKQVKVELIRNIIMESEEIIKILFSIGKTAKEKGVNW